MGKKKYQITIEVYRREGEGFSRKPTKKRYVRIAKNIADAWDEGFKLAGRYNRVHKATQCVVYGIKLLGPRR